MNKPKVLICSSLPGNTENCLTEGFEMEINRGDPYSQEELLKRAHGKDAVISVLTNKIDAKFFNACPSVKLVANVAVGYDNIDLNEAITRGIIVSNTPGVLTETTADLAFTLILSAARRSTNAESFLRQGRWQRFALDLLLGTDVHHKTLGIIGFGRIGQAVARRALGFSMKVLYTQRNRVNEALESELKAKYVSKDELFNSADFISINCPLMPETRHLISHQEFKAMKPSAILINTSRGPVVDEAALVQALKDGTIYGAGLDVYENEPAIHPGLLELDNVTLLPHIGSATIETRTAMGQLAVDAVNNSFHKRMPSNLVNPESWNSFLSKLNS